MQARRSWSGSRSTSPGFGPLMLDIDELVNDFAEAGSTTFAEMKKVWASKKFSFIFEACPPKKQGFFMQSLYAHSIGYMTSAASISHRVGGLYCLYCLYETQPFKPPFKIYLSLGELKSLKSLVVDAKEKNIRIVSTLVKRMLDNNIFLFGLVDTNESSATDRVNELTDIQNAHIQSAYKKLFENTRIEHFLHMDLDKEFDFDELKKMSRDYAEAKELAITEASKVMDVEDVKHIVEYQTLIGDVVGKIAEDWDLQKQLFYQQIGLGQSQDKESQQREDDVNFEHQKTSEFGARPQYEDNENVDLQEHTDEQQRDDDDFIETLEQGMLVE